MKDTQVSLSSYLLVDFVSVNLNFHFIVAIQCTTLVFKLKFSSDLLLTTLIVKTLIFILLSPSCAQRWC